MLFRSHPGHPGVGEKTAAALIQTFGTIGAITDALDRGHGGFPKGSRAKVAAARDYLAVAMPVVRVAPDPEKLDALDARWDLGSSLRRACSSLYPA